MSGRASRRQHLTSSGVSTKQNQDLLTPETQTPSISLHRAISGQPANQSSAIPVSFHYHPIISCRDLIFKSWFSPAIPDIELVSSCVLRLIIGFGATVFAFPHCPP